ncbi:TetR/AcrR family transcriptional regulator [Mumia sp. DW29H23]|uniref:TetR/AcrR family transcriptional regulator n=1 Tax=Mumia sp. DW29H23 TaxID=3421241 RepID=UPI003D697CCD
MTQDVRRPDQPRRADARRSIEAILEAATRCLARNPDVSLNEIAREAGVGRMTLYGHFESRSALVAEVVDRALREAEDELEAVDVSGDPSEAMERLLGASLRVTYRFGGLVQAAEQTLSPERVHEAHTQQIRRAKELLERGRREGAFRRDLPLDWQITTLQSLLHAAATSVHQGTLTADQAPGLVATTALAALAAGSDDVR